MSNNSYFACMRINIKGVLIFFKPRGEDINPCSRLTNRLIITKTLFSFADKRGWQTKNCVTLGLEV